jgi:hypothetical protein
MSTLAEIHERVASAMSRISRRLGRWFWRRVVDAFNAFKSLIIFVPLIYLIGFGIELQYSTRPTGLPISAANGYVSNTLWAMVAMTGVHCLVAISPSKDPNLFHLSTPKKSEP